jgi:hypothetical protein
VTSIQTTSTGDKSSPIPYLAYGTLSMPVPLTPAQPSPPPGYSLGSCDYVETTLEWIYSDFTFQNYTKAQCKQWYGEERHLCLDPPGWRDRGLYLNVTVANAAIEYSITCNLTLSDDTSKLPAATRCVGGDFGEIALDISLTGTAPNYQLAVEQLWYCLENPKTNVNP